MNFASLGNTPRAHRLLDAIAGSDSDRVIVVDPGRWEDLLDRDDLDAVILADGGEAEFEIAGKLLATGRMLVVVPGPGLSATAVHRLALARDESRTPVIDAGRYRDDPALAELVERFNDGAVGTPAHLSVTRWLPPAESGPVAAAVSSSDIDRCLLEDLGLLRRLGGDYRQVTALRDETPDGEIIRASVTLAGERLPGASWVLQATDEPAGVELLVAGSSGSACWSGRDDGHGQLVIDDLPITPSEPADPGRRLLDRIHAAANADVAPDDLDELVRIVETVDGARRSLARRRTIDLHFDAMSERTVFKSQMTALGCGLLMLTFMGLLGFLLAGALLVDSQGPAGDVAARIVDSAFRPGTAVLTNSGQRLVEAVEARRRGRGSLVVIVATGQAELDRQRREIVVETLVRSGRRDADLWVVVRADGGWIGTLFKIARVAWIAPLVLFLLLQVLIFWTRPAAPVSPK